MQSIGTLASGVAHEFNNLLAGISGYASLGLDEPEATGTVREFLQHIVELSERAATLTRQLLAFARKPPLVRQAMPVEDMLRATTEFVTRSLRVPVHVDVEPTPAGPLLVEGDFGQLQQALVNLALNARDAQKPPASITFRLRPECLSAARPGFPQSVPPGDYVVLEVVDKGSGMPSDVLAQSLDPFFTTKDVGRGTGLGLPVVFGIVHAHQGFLTIDSVPGQGTRVGLHLPRLTAAPPADPLPVPDASAVPDLSTLGGRRVLLIEHDPAILEVLRRLLESAGHRVLSAAKKSEALTHLDKEPSIALVVLDLALPDSAAALFRQLVQRRAGLPVLLSGNAPVNEVAPLIAAGAAGVIAKPFQAPDLLRAVEQALPPRRPG
jgi:CheY-like chemotaxis protein